MRSSGRLMRFFGYFLLGLAVAFGIAACDIGNVTNDSEPLPTVSPLRLPQLPDWIEQISPTGEADTLAQIRIRFKDPLIPVERLDSNDQQRLLKNFEILPPLDGHFRFLTPRMVGFQADRAIPKATRVRVTLKAGLEDLNNHRLEEDLAWTFNTEAIQLTNLPTAQPRAEGEVEPIDIKPTLTFNANTELKLESLNEHLIFTPQGQDKRVPLEVKLDDKEENPSPQAQFNPQRTWTYIVQPRQTLKKATQYQLKFSPGISPVRGNLATENPTVTELTTYAPLKFNDLKFVGKPDAGGAYGRFVKGQAQLQFNNGLVAESASKNITISPKPKDTPNLIEAYENSPHITINPWALEPTTTYTITIGANLEDKFGQTLGKPITVKYETGDVAADIWAPSGLNVFPTNKDLQLDISTVNLPQSQYQAAFRVVQPQDLVYVDSAYPSGNNTLLPSPETWQSFSVSGKKNQSTEVTIPLRDQLGSSTGMLAYGIAARTNQYVNDGKDQWREPRYYGMVQLTNLGVFAQWFPESGLVRVNHLSDGSAVREANVEIYQSQLNTTSRGAASPCLVASTDQTGILRLNGQQIQQCTKDGSSRFNEPPELLVIARENDDWAFARTQAYSGAYGYGIDAGWNGGTPQSRGTIFSDRQLYQPGETAWFTGTAYYLQNGELKQDKNVPYQVTLQRPDGKTTALGTQVTNEFGTFSLEIPLTEAQPLGFYSIRAKGETGAEISGEFRVAEFKPPNFNVDLSLSKDFALTDEVVEANVYSNYLFGVPVEGATVNYYVTRKPTTFTPQGWEDFSFGRQWFWPEEQPSVPTDVLQTSAVLAEEGTATQTVTVAKDLPYPMIYQMDVEVSDVSNLSVSDSQTFTALPSDRLIGLQANFVAEAGQPFPVQVIVTDPTGETMSGQSVRLELQKMDYSSVTQVVEGSQTAHNQVEYERVEQTTIRSGKEAETASVTPPEPGSYRLRATVGNDEATATDLQIWATGSDAVSWGNPYRENNRLEIKLNKDTYQVGETATALIQSPYAEGELYFAIVRDKPLYQRLVKVEGGAPEVQFPVTLDMLPNAAVEAVLVRQGEPLSEVEPGSLENLMQVGFAPFKTQLEGQYLQVDVTPQQAQLQPGNDQTIQLSLKDLQGEPIQGQFTVMVVNDAVLQLSGYRPPDLVETVYAEQAIATRFSDNRSEVVLETMTSAMEKGWGYGGGLSAAGADTHIRTDFRPLAYYNGSLRTNSQGEARLRFELPDDLTTWRVMVVATDGELHFGNGEASFVTTQPLMANPVLPQFVRLGDRFEAGLSVTNTTGEGGNLEVEGNLSESVEFDDRLKNQQRVLSAATPGTEAFRFPMLAVSPGQAQVTFSAQLETFGDAFEVPLDVKPLGTTESAIESGASAEPIELPLSIDREVAPDTGGLEVSLASTLIPEITAPAREAFNEEQLPFLEPLASQLLIAANLESLSQTFPQSFAEFNPTQQATLALERLQTLQQADGGFAVMPGEEASDPIVTPYAALAIARGGQAFAGSPDLAALQDDSAMVSGLKAYLAKILADPGQYEFCRTDECKNQVRLDSLVALAALGDRRNDFLASLYDARDRLDPVNQLKLARYLLESPEFEQEAQALFEQLQETVYETGRTATVNLPESWRWRNSPTAAQAQALRLFIAREAEPEVLDRLLQGLLALRRNGTWPNTYDSAQALTAVVDYSQVQPTPPNFTATVKLDRKTLGSARFQGYQNPSTDLEVPMAELPRGQHQLVLDKSGQGVLHYLVAYRYRLRGSQPGRLNGLRVTRNVRPANQEKVLRDIGLYADDEPLQVDAGQVFDIGLEIISDHRVNHVTIIDPLPAGFEAVDTSFQTSTSYFQPQQDSWEIDYQNISSDRVEAYAEHLEAGVYTLHYLVRAVTPGRFEWPGAEVRLHYAPEEFGRSASSTLEIRS